VQVNDAKTYGVLGLNERVVDGDDVDVLVLDAARCQIPILLLCVFLMNIRVAEDDATNAAETVDTDLWQTIS
jgi:hypothetical protein